MKRLFDAGLALAALLATWPLLLLAAIGIRLCSPGPVLYRAVRTGWRGRDFVMYKFRTMHARTEGRRQTITGAGDPRIFRFGQLLRRLKIDELPQLWNVLRGEMSIVGPRPEDPAIVRDHYTAWQRETLDVLPGVASPGSIFNYTHGDAYLRGDDVEGAYARDFLPIKLALELVYVRHRSFMYDLRLLLRTVSTIVQIALGRRRFPDPPELAEARRILREYAHSAT